MSDNHSDTTDDLSALAWVHEELRRSLEAAHKALRRFVKDAEAVSGSDVDAVDPAVLRTAHQQIHQGVGALELVGLPAVASVLRASEAAVKRFVAKPQKMSSADVDVIEQASFALLDYLQRLLAGKPLSTLALFPRYREVQTLAGADRVHPADLWTFDWQWREIPAEAGAAPRVPDAAARSEMEQQMLLLMRGQLTTAARRMSDTCAALGAGASDLAASTLWKLAAGFFEGQALGLLTADVFSKRVASRLLAQLRIFERGESEVSERLAQDLLFFCAQTPLPADGRSAPRVAAVREAYHLGKHQPVDYETSRLGRYDPAWVLQAKKRVSSAKDAWSGVAGGEMHRLGGLAEQFSLVGDSLRKLYPSGEVLADELQGAIVQTQHSGAAPDTGLAMEVATSVLYLESSLEDTDFDHPEQAQRVRRLAQRIANVRSGLSPDPLEAWMEELYRRVSDRQTMGSVVQELRASLGEIEKQIDQFFRKPTDRDVLVPVPGQLSSMRGVMSVLGMDQATQALLRMRDDVEGLISTDLDPQGVVESGIFDRLAGNLGALGFLIDMLAAQPHVAKSLFVFDPVTGALSPLMGRSAAARQATNLSVPKAAPAVEPRVLEQAQALAEAAVSERMPLDMLSNDLERLQEEAQAADQSGLVAKLEVAQHKIEQAQGVAEINEAREQLSETLNEFVITAGDAVGLDPLPHPTPAPAPTPVAPAVTASAPAPVAAATVPGSDLADDPEMREIFLEEAREKLVEARDSLAQIARSPSDIEQITAVRRAFHTFKGSSRMVGLKEFGDAAWAGEQLYNTWLAGQNPASPQLVAFTQHALNHLDNWIEAIASGNAGAYRSGPLVRAAEAFGRGEAVGPIVPDAAPAADVAPAATPIPVADVDLPFDLPTPVAAAAAPGALPELAFDLDLGALDDTPAAPPVDVPTADVSDLPAFDLTAGLPPVEAPALRAEEAVLEMLDTADAVPAAESVELIELDLGADVFADAAPAAEAPALDLTLATDLSADAQPAALPDVEALDISFDAFDAPLSVGETVEVPPMADVTVADADAVPVADADAVPFEQAVEAIEAAVAEPAPFASDDDQVRIVGPLRISIPLFNIYLNEADELSRKLTTEVAEWAMELHRPVGETPIALAHSLAGSSATVGFADLSQLARTLEHALMRSQAIGHGTTDEGRLFVDAAEEVRRLLHQFAAGFLKTPSPELLARLAEHELSSARRLEEANAAVDAQAANDDDLPTAPIAPVDADAPPPVADAPVHDTGHGALDSGIDTDAELPAVTEVPAEPIPVAAADLDLPVDLPVAVPVDVAPVAADAAPADARESAFGGLPELGELGQAEFKAFTPLPDATPVASATPFRGGHGVDADDVDDDIDSVDAVDAELFPIFEEEAEELLPQLSSALRDWTREPGQGAHPASCMRTLHTLKGGARLAGAMRLGELAHRLETAIEHLVQSENATTADVQRLEARADGLANAFESLKSRDAQAYAEAAQAIVTPVAVAPVVETPVAPPVQPVLEAVPALPVLEPTALVPSLPLVTEPVADPVVDSVVEALAATPEVPAVPVTPSGEIDWGRFAGTAVAEPELPGGQQVAAAHAAVRVRGPLLERMVNQAGEVSITRSRIEAEVGNMRGSLGDLTDNLERLRQQLRDIELQAETQMLSRQEAAKAAHETFDPLESDRFTRFQELTRMMAESVNDVATVQRTLQRTLETTEDELVAQARLTRDLQDDLLRTRMVEFESLSDRLYRVVRQAAKETGKQVRLDILGGSIEIDRGVLDRMTGAFEHLLRNCVTHGIERPDVRTASGKDATGNIVVVLRQEGNEVSVEFRDDGAGLNLARIRQKAEKTGLVTPGSEHSDGELANLIFMPGFSTAETVTELAGRGVGMDVVRSEVNAMGGRIETATAAGQGTAFTLVLPLTTAVTQVVMLRCGDSVVAVPATLIEIVRRLSAAEIEQAYQSGSYTLAERSMLFFWFGALLQQGPVSAETGRTRPVVVVRSAQQRVALHVDEVLGTQEVVVKNLGPQLSRLPGLAGMTLLASGSVALIYNPVALATLYGDAARTATQAARLAPAQQVAKPTAEEARRHLAPLVLVVDDSLTVRRVTQRLLTREGFRVTLAKDGIEALERLADERPQVVLSDIEMPRMDGFDLARNIRGDARMSDLPIIMITSRIAQKHRDYAAELGVDHYLGKPYSEEDLLALIGRYTTFVAAPA